jgi:hypothetical protein
MSIEIDAYDFLKEEVEAISDSTSPLYQAAVLKDEYEEMPKDKPRGIRIGRCISSIAPNVGQTEVKHFDAELIIIFYVRIERGMKQERTPFREAALQMAEAAALLFYNKPGMNGRSDDANPLTLPRGMDDVDSLPYAISNLYVIINDTGQFNFANRRAR